jgi:hypothetical protein
MNKKLLERILKLPLRRWIVTKYGTYENVHLTMKAVYDESKWCSELYEYILSEYHTFKTKAK